MHAARGEATSGQRGEAVPRESAASRRFSHLLSAPSRRRVDDDDDDERSAAESLTESATLCAASSRGEPRAAQGCRTPRGLNTRAAQSIRGGWCERWWRWWGTHAVQPRVTDAREPQCVTTFLRKRDSAWCCECYAR